MFFFKQANYLKLFVFILLCFPVYINAQEEEEEPQKRTSKKQSQEVINPTSIAWQLQLEEFAIFNSEGSDGFAQDFRIRAIIPVKEGWLLPFPELLRVIAFVNTAPDGTTGLGDLTLNQFWVFVKKDWGQFGAGWSLKIPTAIPRELGGRQWQLGPAVTVSFSDLGNWQMYWIFENFFSLNRNDTLGHNNLAILQPNIFYTWENGIYVGMDPEWLLDYNTGDIAIPLNFRVGYVWAGKLKYNAYVEPEFMAYRSDGFTKNTDNFGVRLGFRWYLPI